MPQSAHQACISVLSLASAFATKRVHAPSPVHIDVAADAESKAERASTAEANAVPVHRWSAHSVK